MAMNVYRYSEWDGTQQVFEPSEEDIMGEMADDLMNHGDLMRSLRNLLQRGMQDQSGERMQGLRDMLEQLRKRRQEQLQQYNLDSVVDDFKERLKQITDTERQGIDRRLEEARQQQAQSSPEDAADQERLMKLLEERASRNKERLDNLPPNLGGAVKELNDYDFMDPEAQRQFQELMDMLKQRVLDNTFQNLRQQIQSMSPEDMAATREMLHDLNQMLQDQMQGLEPDFQGFMDRYGDLFGPDQPQNLEELMESLQRQMGQAQSLMDSMSPEMRRELQELMEGALDPETMNEMAQLAAAMNQLYPPDDMANQYPFMGEDSLTYDEAMELMGELQSMDELERQIQEVARRGNVQDLDLNEVEELVGEDARRNLEQLQRITKKLEEAGYVTRKGERLELTPKGIRKIGQKAMKDIFSQLKKDRLGQHQLYLRGAGGEHSGETKIYEFGDPFDIHLERTVRNALLRDGSGVPVKITPPDFEIHRTEHMSQASTVLLLDQSRSMGMYGSFLAAKKAAMALSTLIRSQFPRDKFYIVGFSDYAIELKEDELPQVSWNDWVSGTNMQHAFMLARKLMARDKGGTRQILMVTDGEPTTHLEGDNAYFSYPPSYKTIQETLKEVRRCTQEGITINTFMLESSAYLVDFVDRMMRINKGRAFYSNSSNLGEYVLVDYLSNRKRRIA
ncbi:MAG: VWA domain-containing protein [Chloroflexi bacterium]|nr:VWA domain-containing protein [Chloroflexota bacterium]